MTAYTFSSQAIGRSLAGLRVFVPDQVARDPGAYHGLDVPVRDTLDGVPGRARVLVDPKGGFRLHLA